MKTLALKTYGKFIAFLLALAGFIVGCDEPMDEYGVPSADFKAKGTVTDAANNKPIRNIRVIGKPVHGYEADTTFTDAEGNYTVEMKGIIGFPVTIYAEDIDGALNGWHRPDSMRVEQRDTKQIKKGNGWYDRVFEKNNVNFKLKYPTAIPMYGIPSAEIKEKK